MVTIVVKPVYGDIKCFANQLTLTAIPTDERDDSQFNTIVRAEKPSSTVFPMEYVYSTDLFTTIGSLNNNKVGYVDSIGYAKAIMPDWVDIGEKIAEYEPDPYPSPSEVKIDFEQVLSGYCSNMFVDIPSEEKLIGKNGKDILRSDEITVEFCDNTNSILEDVKIYELNPVDVNVIYDMEVTVDTNVGSISGNDTFIRSISVASNKNNFIDLYIDMNGILTIENLPNGLSYKNKHISGIPLKSGTYISTINFDPNITDVEKYTIRFNIPSLERIL